MDLRIYDDGFVDTDFPRQDAVESTRLPLYKMAAT